MAATTYRELRAELDTLTEEQLDSDVTIQTPDDEFFGNINLTFSEENDVLDEGHPYLYVSAIVG
jgi:hypothetical protein